jgi:hypothetical protein
MSGPAGSRVFTILKVLSYISLACTGAVFVYAATVAMRYWPGGSV